MWAWGSVGGQPARRRAAGRQPPDVAAHGCWRACWRRSAGQAGRQQRRRVRRCELRVHVLDDLVAREHDGAGGRRLGGARAPATEERGYAFLARDAPQAGQQRVRAVRLQLRPRLEHVERGGDGACESACQSAGCRGGVQRQGQQKHSRGCRSAAGGGGGGRPGVWPTLAASSRRQPAGKCGKGTLTHPPLLGPRPRAPAPTCDVGGEDLTLARAVARRRQQRRANGLNQPPVEC